MKSWLTDVLIVAVALAALTGALAYLTRRNDTLWFHALFLLGCFGFISGINMVTEKMNEPEYLSSALRQSLKRGMRDAKLRRGTFIE